MASNYPALMIKQPESPVQQIGQVMQLKSAMQGQQMQQLQIQQEQQQIKDQHALTSAMASWDGSDMNSLPKLVINAGGSGNAALQMTQHIFQMKQAASEIAKNDSITSDNQLKNKTEKADATRGTLLSIIQNPDPAAKQASWDSELTKEEQAGTIPPGSISHNYADVGDAKATALANSLALGSKLAQEALDRQKLAQEAWKSAGGALVNTVTGEKIADIKDVSPLNQGLKARWNVMNPGEEVPDYFQLKAGATPEDFSRMDKLLQATETAAQSKLSHQDQVKAQQVSESIRNAMMDLATNKEGYNWVTGTATKGPSAGKVVAVPQSAVGQYGIQDPGKMEGVDITKTQSGRQWLTLANKQAPASAPPEEKGIGQLLDELDKDGKLGPLAGRWNEFLAGKFGSGDPKYTALRTKLDLSNTLLATVHSGRLGPFLMENMQGLAAAGKMDGPTLKAAFKSEQDYVGDRAMDPNPPNYSQQGKANTPATAQSGMIRARDPQGVLHEAKSGTVLPKGWTLEK